MLAEKIKYKENEENKDYLLHIEATLNLIPYVGGFLATYFGEIRSKRVVERIEKYLKYFSDRLEELDKNKIDYDYLKSEEFAELFLQGAEQAAKSTTEKRIRRFANILLNNALIDAKSRDRTQSVMSLVDRISDLDAFILLCYGHPKYPSLRAKTKDEAVLLVEKLANYLNIAAPERTLIIESIVYMDNLGLTWVNEKFGTDSDERGKDLILKEFSSFRTPLGDAVALVIAPPGFYVDNLPKKDKLIWPDDYVSKKFKKLEDFKI